MKKPYKRRAGKSLALLASHLFLDPTHMETPKELVSMADDLKIEIDEKQKQREEDEKLGLGKKFQRSGDF